MSSAYKLDRNYSLTINSPNLESPLIVSLPFTIEFDITRNTLTSANVCQIRLYNLSQTNRNALRRNATGYSFPFEPIVLRAGYGDQLPIIFSGNVSQAWSVREGVNFVTQLECYDGGFAFTNGQTNLTVPAGTPRTVVIGNMIKTLPNVQLGAVGSYPGTTSKTNTYTGNTTQILDELTGGGFYIDNGTGNALGNSEYALGADGVILIDASAGLLNTPVLEQTILRFDMIFEPQLVAGAGVMLDSSTLDASLIKDGLNNNSNGLYKITSVKHRGMISETVCGDAVTTGEFFFLTTPTPVVNFGN